EDMGNLAYAASTASQLGRVCQLAGRPAEAESWVRRALDAFHALGDRRYEAVCANNLAALLLDVEALPPEERPAPFRGRDLLAEAEEYAHRAREIREALDDPSSEVWKTYATLAIIAKRRGRAEEARAWRRREQESFAAFAGAEAQLPQWVGPVVAAVVAACEGSEEARGAVEEALRQMAATEDWRNLPPVIRRILAGERDLESLTDGLDAWDALIIRRTLAALEGGGAARRRWEAQPSAGSSGRRGEVPPSVGSSDRREEGRRDQDVLTLDQLFALVEAGCRGDAQAGQLAYNIVAQALQALAAPPELRALGRSLERILVGIRGEDALEGLPAELRPPVEELLRRLEPGTEQHRPTPDT
ncbi:MAG: hypothetical protein DRI79_08780, partial [Chloroflexi bacterium]